MISTAFTADLLDFGFPELLSVQDDSSLSTRFPSRVQGVPRGLSGLYVEDLHKQVHPESRLLRGCKSRTHEEEG